jgi:hypothetical protein
MGMTPVEFWRLTYAEFIGMQRGFVRRDKRRYNERLQQAWYTARLVRLKGEMPDLESLMLNEDPAPRQMTDDQMMAMARVLNAALGGREIEV